ncbi:hypothetical protein C8J56DRAFT_1064799 [Mycena floridula]|nr:hypothetical protein C8J56DRAFT_1064799 [Mycena floridula]
MSGVLSLEDEPFFEPPIISPEKIASFMRFYGLVDNVINSPLHCSRYWIPGLRSCYQQWHRQDTANFQTIPFDLRSVSVIATHPLSVGRRRRSQTWLGSMTSSTNSQPWPVIIKLFRLAFFPGGYLNYSQDTPGTGATMVLWLFKFQFSEEEIVIDHVMEYVPGRRADLAIRHRPRLTL